MCIHGHTDVRKGEMTRPVWREGRTRVALRQLEPRGISRRESPTPCAHPLGQKRRLECWDNGLPVLGAWLGSRAKFWGSSPLATARKRL